MRILATIGLGLLLWLCAPRGVSAGEPAVTRITRSATSKFFVRHTPDGSHLVYSSQHANRRASNQVLVGARIVRVDGTDDRALLPTYGAQVQIQEHPQVSGDGTHLLISGGGNDTGNSSKDTFIADLDKSYQATQLRKLVPGDGVTLGEEPVWSPDGRRIAFVTIDERVWVVDADGKHKSLVAQVAGQYCHQPEWSPDGERIVFASDRAGSVDLVSIRWDGTELTSLTDHPGIDCRPRWSRDGRWILFSSNRAGNFDLYVARADGSDVRQLTNHTAPDDHADWSPDGKSIVFVSLRDGAFDLYRLPVPSDLEIGERLLPAKPSTQPQPDDVAAFYAFDREVVSSAVAADATQRNPAQLFDTKFVREGKRGSLAFDGVKSYASCGNGELLRISSALTISVWVRPTKLEGNHYLVSKHGWNIYLGATGIPQFETRSAKDDAWDTLAAAIAVPLHEWTQVVAVFNPAAQTLATYINGRLSTERPRRDGSLGAAAGYPLELGHYNLTKSQKFCGELDEVRILRRALTVDEIAASYRDNLERVTGKAR